MSKPRSSRKWSWLIVAIAATGLLLSSPAPSAAAKKDK